jgi:hypothetical protein
MCRTESLKTSVLNIFGEERKGVAREVTVKPNKVWLM